VSGVTENIPLSDRDRAEGFLHLLGPAVCFF